jgi:hypothetical protein
MINSKKMKTLKQQFQEKRSFRPKTYDWKPEIQTVKEWLQEHQKEYCNYILKNSIVKSYGRGLQELIEGLE